MSTHQWAGALGSAAKTGSEWGRAFQNTRGIDLYNELERLTQEWPFGLEYFTPVKSKEIRLEACVPLFANERVWAPLHAAALMGPDSA